ncbi:hypothetical protein K1719_030102 [Acacia pycnantha]|nr:hypothetical protein K1719_030102 [Acacia pycnantha]
MPGLQLQTNDASTSKSADGGIFIKFMHEILNALVKVFIIVISGITICIAPKVSEVFLSQWESCKRVLEESS